MDTLLNGGDLGQAFKAGVVGGASGFLAFAAGGVTGNSIGAILERMGRHAFANGWLAAMQGQNMFSGMLTGGASSLGGAGLESLNIKNVGMLAAGNAVIGGTVSVIGGGKFANGAVTGAFTMLFNELMHEANKLDKSKQNNATKQFIAIVVGESTNNVDEAAAIGSVIMNRLDAIGASISDGFVDKIGGAGQYDAIGGPHYEKIMKSSWESILNSDNPYYSRIAGAIMSLSGTDYSGGAYMWNASSPQTGFNWRMYDKGIFSITKTIGGTTFFKYSNTKKTWP